MVKPSLDSNTNFNYARHRKVFVVITLAIKEVIYCQACKAPRTEGTFSNILWLHVHYAEKCAKPSWAGTESGWCSSSGPWNLNSFWSGLEEKTDLRFLSSGRKPTSLPDAWCRYPPSFKSSLSSVKMSSKSSNSAKRSVAVMETSSSSGSKNLTFLLSPLLMSHSKS